jgi:hypothetical protein
MATDLVVEDSAVVWAGMEVVWADTGAVIRDINNHEIDELEEYILYSHRIMKYKKSVRISFQRFYPLKFLSRGKLFV